MAYLVNQFIIGIVIFVTLIVTSVIGWRSKTVIIRELTRHSRTGGDSCSLSMDLIVMNALRQTSVLLRGFYAYMTMYFVRMMVP